jgi:membrane protein YqaA with SNARE-associated domain
VDHSLLGWHLTTFAYAWLSGLLPFLNAEVYLVWLAASAPRAALWSLVATATAGQMVAKCLLFWGGRGLLRLPFGGRGRGILDPIARAGMHGRCASLGPTARAALVFASAVTGLPPFYGLSVACGALRWSFALFVVCGTAGRLARFSALAMVPAGLPRLPGPLVLAAALVAAALLPAAVRTVRRRSRAAEAALSPLAR